MISRERLAELWRYYQVGIVNAVFGFVLYAVLVRIGLNLYVAQAIAQVAGVSFNYLTYSRHVFRQAGAAKLRFVASYVVNYLVSLTMLALAASVIQSPYLAGLVAIVLASAINYFALKYLVFTRAAR